METTKQLQSMNMRTGKTKALTKSAKSILLLLATLVMGQAEAWAQKVLPYEYGFENNDLASEGWTTSNLNLSSGIGASYKKTGSYGFRFYYNSNPPQYIISPEVNAPAGASNVKVSFYYKTPGSYGPETFQVGYSTTTNSTDAFNGNWDNEVSTSVSEWTLYETTFPVNTKYISIKYNSNNKYYLYIDDITFSCDYSGPALSVYDGINTITNGHDYNFGLAIAGTTKTFTLKNPGTESLTVAVSKTGSFGATLSSTNIAAGGEVTLTVTMPSTTGSSSVTITPAAESGLDPFVINVSGTIRDPNKVYETLLTGSIPEDWTTSGGTWSWSTTNGASSSAWYETSNYRLITPKLTVAAGEKFLFDAQGTYSGYQGVIFEYSTDGTTWTASSASTTVSSDWQTFIINDIPAGSYFIAIHGWHVNIRNFYGGELPIEPKMVVTQPASLDYGVINTNTDKTFTIANTGLATLEGINVTSSNDAFTITGAPTSLAVGASQEVTITMSAETTGALSSDITVSATGMENVVFTVKGVVLPDGMPVEDFSGTTIPTNWTSSGSWNFATDGLATGTSSSAYLYTPKLKFSAGDFLVIKMAPSDSYSGDYLTISGSDNNGSTYTAYTKKLEMPQGKDVYATYVVSDIPTTINKIRFTGYYVNVDEISGLTYAPVLSVTTGDPAATVETPAAYDFGECAANATVTYNFANAGAGTINITNVAITGAAAYSTNWTESVACPYSLTITRTYDASRAEAGAQDAVVTVTTSEGAFVINVTGTDKAANAPELAVKLGEDAVTTGDAADFGSKLQAAPAAKTYTITNTGTGTLTGTIATSDDSQFTVSKTSFSLAAAESTTFDVALVFNTTYGTKAATITIHPTIDGLADVVINATASTLDPEAWTEDFAGGTLPMGWEANTWTIGSDSNYENKTTMALAPGSSTAGTIITPCLTAKKDDILTWDAYFKWADESLIVEYSTDNKITWNPYVTVYGTASGEKGSGQVYYHKEMAFTAPADGDYYLRFTSTYNNGIDNFAGFKLNLPDHIMVISANTIPASTSNSVTMKEGQSFDATVTVKETRGVAETGVVAKLYMGSTVIGTSVSTDFEANESKVITIPCTPTTSAVDGIEMHIEVEYAGGKLSTENVTRYVAAITYLTLDETSSDAVVAGTYDHVTLKRKFNKDWNTVCLPFTINDVEAFFGAGAKAYNFTSYSNGELGFTRVTTLTASYPYIVYVPAAITEDIALTDITIASGDASAWYRYQSGAYFRGTYAPIAAGDWTKNTDTDNIYGVTSEGKIAKAGASATMKGFRAYFDLPTGTGAPSLSVQDQTTGITTIVSEGSQQNGEVYNLNGQKVNAPSKGLYIINGRKVVVK